MFELKLFDKINIERIDSPEGRKYKVPSGELYPSVTTLLSSHGKEKLDKWRKSVGEDKANRISTKARIRGTAVHNICEKYLLGEDYTIDTMPFNLSEFNKLKPLLDSNVNPIYGIEHKLYSHILKAAGTCDLLCKWKGVNSVVDFKTSRYVKKEEDIENYFIQATSYCIMAQELYNIAFTQIVILMVVDHEEPLIFCKSRNDYIDKVKSVFITNRG